MMKTTTQNLGHLLKAPARLVVAEASQHKSHKRCYTLRGFVALYNILATPVRRYQCARRT